METGVGSTDLRLWPLAISLLIVLTAAVTFSWLFFRGEAVAPDGNNISSFEKCVEAGNPVMESYPRQCRAGNQTFTEYINDSEAHGN